MVEEYLRINGMRDGTPNSTDWWDDVADKWKERGLSRDRPNEYKAMADRIQRGPVLEVGCGFGDFCKYIPRRIDYMGIDVSGKMIEECRKRWVYRLFVQKDVITMNPFAYKFEHTVCAQTLEHFTPDNFKHIMDVFKDMTRKSLLFSVPRGKPSVADYNADGHIIGWENESELIREFSVWGSVTIIDGPENHITGEVVYG